jgi:D-glycero-alpha-D-manno-heptose-7-phosphate kinase
LADGTLRKRELPTEYRATAPMRLDFAGAWTDVPPFSAREGGVVVNGAIALRAHVELKLGGTTLKFVAAEFGETFECANSGGLTPDGKLPLLKAALRMFPVLGGFTLTTRCDAPPGSGLGTSGALGVAVVGALTRARLEQVDGRELAEQAWQVEAVEAQLPGGRQDQYAAALGGFHRFTFRDPDVGVEPLTLDPAFAAALERQTLLCYTNRSRVSGNTISRVMQAYERGDARVTSALKALKETGERMGEALRGADLARVGTLLSENWKHQRALDPGMQIAEMARLEEAMKQAGALGGKAAGAGAGGSMFFVMKGDARAAAAAAAAAGATVLPLQWAGDGIRAW